MVTLDGSMKEIISRLSKASLLALTVAGYGAIHIAAWKHTFASSTQSQIWRLSSIWITMNGIIVCTTHALMNIVLPVIWRINLLRRNYNQPNSGDIHLFVLALSFPMYVAASASIFVLCFIDLFHLPPGAFTDILWSKFIPHFS